jgi:hypothetical protein
MPAVGRLFRGAIALGIILSLAALAAPWWLPVRSLQEAVGADKHPDLVAALPELLRRTGVLYLAGYAVLLVAWAALGSPAHPGPVGRLLERLPRLRPRLRPADVPVALPLLAIVLVVVISTFRPTFNSRYLLALMPFGLLGMAVAMWRLTPRGARLAAIALVTAAQAASLAGQRDAYARLKPDYKGALEYASRLGRPVTGNAVWELDNLSRYYAGRREIPPLSVVARPEAMKLDRSVVFVAEAYPLDAPHLADLKGLVHTRARRSRAFDGLTLYEIGPDDSQERMARHP